MHQGVVAVVEDEEDRQVFLDQQVAERVGRGGIGLLDVFVYGAANKAGVVPPRQPGNGHPVEGVGVAVEDAGEAAADRGIVEFGQDAQRAVLPYLVGQHEVEHGRAGQVRVHIEAEVHLVDRDLIHV